MNQKRTLARVGAGIVIVLAVAGLAFTARLYLREQNLPVYEMGERPAERNIGVNTLTRGPVTYISGPDEFPLQPVWPPALRAGRIGKTEDGALYLYRPYGQTGDDYVYATGDMMPAIVYRNERIPAAALATLPVSEIRLFQNISGSPVKKTTRDAQVIQAAVAALTDTAAKPASFPADDVSGALGYVLLLSDRLPGLADYADVHADSAGRVYLRLRGPSEDAWMPVGDAFAIWVKP
jgi:hypothetical protein